MTFEFTKSFHADYQALPKHIQLQVNKAIVLFEQNPHHPSLRVKKLRGTRHVWEARVTRGYRMTFHWEQDVITLRRVGTHDILEREA